MRRGRNHTGLQTVTCDKCKSYSKRADRFCTNCRAVFCITCCEVIHDNTPEHIIVDIGENTSSTEQAQASSTSGHAARTHHFSNEHFQAEDCTRSKSAYHIGSDEYRDNRERPGKPYASGDITADSIVINWSKPNTTVKRFKYEVRGKRNDQGRWKYYETLYARCSARISNLQRNTKYVFQVRIVADDDDSDFPWSERSYSIKTKQSAAYLLFSNRKYCIVSNHSEIPQVGSLQFVKERKDERAKIRKLIFGKEDTSYTQEKTVLFLGETGSGKTTLADRFINHIMAVDWNDDFRLSIVDLEKEEQERALYQSQTSWITIYSIAPLNGGRLDYRLNIVDTPGFGDTERSEHEIIEQIKSLFNAENNVSVHALCIVTKGSSNRLTRYQMKLLNSILSIFGKDIIKNIVVMTTFGNAPSPSVLAVLNNAKVPFKRIFSFDNMPFAERTESAGISWKSSTESLNSFFDYISTIFPCNLHLTRAVLEKMVLAEQQIKYLTVTLRHLLRKRRQIQQTVCRLEQCQTEMKALNISIDNSTKGISDSQMDTAKSEEDIKKLEQKLIQYCSKVLVKRIIQVIRQRDIPEPKKALNCRTCHSTCAPDARWAKYLTTWFSSTMTWLGNCKMCGCDSTFHSVDPFEYVTEETEVVEPVSHLLKEYMTTVNKLQEKQRYSAQCKAEADKIKEKLFKQTQHHSERLSQEASLRKCIHTYRSDLQTLTQNVDRTMTNLHQSFDILVKNQLKKTHHSLREYLESCFDDKDKDEFLQELEPFFQYS